MLLSSYLEDMLASIEIKGRGKDPSHQDHERLLAANAIVEERQRVAEGTKNDMNALAEGKEEKGIAAVQKHLSEDAADGVSPSFLTPGRPPISRSKPSVCTELTLIPYMFLHNTYTLLYLSVSLALSAVDGKCVLSDA